MLINGKSTSLLEEKLRKSPEVFCSGLFLSARWFVLASAARSGTHLVVLPDKESAEYCASDLYNLIEGDRVFFLPDTGKKIERSNYKASLEVQRTSALGRIMEGERDGLSVIVSYPAALGEKMPPQSRVSESVITVRKGEEVDYGNLCGRLAAEGFSKVDFVSGPGQFAVRGGLVDIFSYSFNNPFRISFFGSEVESISIFNCNTQLSESQVDSVDIYPELVSSDDEEGIPVSDLFRDDTTVWLDSSDMYRDEWFMAGLQRFRRVYIDTPLSRQDEEQVHFSISPQPVFNKNFELLVEDIRKRTEEGWKIVIFGEKESQLERLKSILSQYGGVIPEFCPGKNIHNGFIDSQDRICCYSDHEIFDRFHRVSIRRSVEKSEQLTINDLTSFK